MKSHVMKAIGYQARETMINSSVYYMCGDQTLNLSFPALHVQGEWLLLLLSVMMQLLAESCPPWLT